MVAVQETFAASFGPASSRGCSVSQRQRSSVAGLPAIAMPFGMVPERLSLDRRCAFDVCLSAFQNLFFHVLSGDRRQCVPIVLSQDCSEPLAKVKLRLWGFCSSALFVGCDQLFNPAFLLGRCLLNVLKQDALRFDVDHF